MSSLERIQSEQGNGQKTGKSNGKERLNELVFFFFFFLKNVRFQREKDLMRVFKYMKSSGKERTNQKIIVSSIILTGSNCSMSDNRVDIQE